MRVCSCPITLARAQNLQGESVDLLLPTIGEIVAAAAAVLLPGAALVGLLWLLFRRRPAVASREAASAGHANQIRSVARVPTATRDGAMEIGLTITVVDPDEDYLGIEVFVSSVRYAGSTRVFAGLDELERLADKLTGFPASAQDERDFELGIKSTVYAGGYVGLFVHTVDSLGHSVIDVEIIDDDQKYSAGSACFTIPVEAAGIDRFVQGLRAAQSARSGSARLASPS